MNERATRRTAEVVVNRNRQAPVLGAVVDRLERAASSWLSRTSVPMLRISMGAIFLVFGALKFFPGVSPAEDIAVQTVAQLTFGHLHGHFALLLVAGLEVGIGIILLTGRMLSLGLSLLVIQMGGILAPLALFPERLFAGPGFAPTIEGQYVLKDFILLAAAAVLWADFLNRRSVGARSFPAGARYGP